MAEFLITLQPIEHFFFGNEKLSVLGNQTVYYSESEYFPQQSSLLGLLRYILLLKFGKLGFGAGDESVINLIGERSFNATDPQIGDFKKIKSLSPVFIRKGSEYFFPVPKDNGLELIAIEGRVSYGSLNELVQKTPLLVNYGAKDPISEMMISNRGNIIPLVNKDGNNGVFCHTERIGNQKSRDGQPITDGYYRQLAWRINPKINYCFAFYASIDEDMEDYIVSVPFGGDRSPFVVSFTKEKNAQDNIQQYLPDQPQSLFHKLVLRSDTCVDEEILSKTFFAITASVGFRNINTYVKTTSNYNKNDTLSGRIFMLKRGSVLYFTDIDSMKLAMKLIDDHQNFKQIGYNLYKSYELKS
ncbi:MAG: type III-B CRISPR module-associated Cmr3 family protein [Saprospiraceae bacterium]